jgi:hypothetical protein
MEPRKAAQVVVNAQNTAPVGRVNVENLKICVVDCAGDFLPLVALITPRSSYGGLSMSATTRTEQKGSRRTPTAAK